MSNEEFVKIYGHYKACCDCKGQFDGKGCVDPCEHYASTVLFLFALSTLRCFLLSRLLGKIKPESPESSERGNKNESM
ncbi:MAG: hypothetical protein HDQ98_11660 [Lachnospiraceae bacterium]|nr:hypothetical protein [Lachnospiraceae bacterium]